MATSETSPHAPSPDERPLSPDELKELTAGMLANNGLFRTNQAELDGRANEIGETLLDSSREYWSYNGELLPMATDAEMEGLKDEVEHLIEQEQEYELPFQFQTPSGHRKELSHEVITEDCHGNQRLYKYVIPEQHWQQYVKASSADTEGYTAPVTMNRPYRVSPRRTVIAAYPAIRKVG